MTSLTTQKDRDAAIVGTTDDDLHRAARKALHEVDHTVFGLLPAVVTRIIRQKAWKTRGRQFNTFGKYALDQTSDGLGVTNNQHLWILRCSMDVHGAHISEWADVLAEVETAVKAYIVETGQRVRDFDGNSLEKLAKETGDHVVPARITYLPSKHKHEDGHLIRMRNSKRPERRKLFREVVSGRITMVEARRKAGMRVLTYMERAKKAVRMLNDEHRAEFLSWLRSEHYI